MSNVDITPTNESYELQGYGIDRRAVPAKYDEQGLSVRAIYIARLDGSQPFVLLSVDVACLCAADTDAARSATYSVPISRHRIMISATHTHNAPASCDAAA